MNQLARQQQDAAARRSELRTRNKPAYEEIQRLAYQIYLSRGGEAGHELEDWLQAERQLKLKRLA